MVRKAYCRHQNKKFIGRFKNISVYECRDCSLVFSSQLNTLQNASKLYEKFYRNEIPARFRFGLEYFVRKLRLFRAYKLITVFPKANSILDIGSGRGFTLYYLKKYFGYQETVGTQLCSSAVKYSREKLGLTIFDKDLLKIDFGRKKFDIVTLWHVLEHVKEPEKYIQKIHSLLKKNGRIIIEVPNYNSWSRKLTKMYWLGMDLKYHLFFFTPEKLQDILRKNRFVIYKRNTFSFEYSTFLSTQSIVSRITKTDQLFFSWLQDKKEDFFVLPHLLLFLLLGPICFVINLLLYFSNSGEVLFYIAKK